MVSCAGITITPEFRGKFDLEVYLFQVWGNTDFGPFTNFDAALSGGEHAVPSP
jgi:hypothetical protein